MKVPKKIPRIEYKKILYTTDLSESGRYAFHHAASLTKCSGAQLTVFHVVEGGPEIDRRLLGYVNEELWEDIKTRNLEEAKSILTQRKRDNAAIKECVGQFCEELNKSLESDIFVTYSIVIKMGDPTEEILKEAEEGAYDLIVMGSHGHESLISAVIGDTVKQVMKKARIPVLIVRVNENAD